MTPNADTVLSVSWFDGVPSISEVVKDSYGDPFIRVYSKDESLQIMWAYICSLPPTDNHTYQEHE